MKLFPFRRLAAIALATSASAISAGAFQSSPQQQAAISAALDRGDDYAAVQKYEEALAAYHQADLLANHSCADCFLRIAKTSLFLGDPATALSAAASAAASAGDNRVLAADAHLLRGGILVATSSDAKDPKFKEAEQEYRAAIAASPKKSIARFSLGMLLLGEGRDAEGVAELQAYVDGPFADPKRVERAQRIIENPSLARAPTSDAFSFTALDGEKISRDGLRGTVVLLDFWGSWCPPCRESIPMVANLNKKFAGQPVKVVGISSDDNEDAWRTFIKNNHMTWTEFLDRDSQVQAIFEIQSFPTFIVLDRNGGIQFRQAGLGDDSESVIESAVNSALHVPYDPASAHAPPSSTATTATATAQPPANAATAPSSAAPSSTLPHLTRGPRANWQAADIPFTAAAILGAEGGAKASEAGYKTPPDDVDNGDADKGIYRNEFLKFSYTYPAKWIPDPPEELERENGNATRWVESQPLAGFTVVPVPKVLMTARPEARARVPFARISVQAAGATDIKSAQEDADRVARASGATLKTPPQPITEGKHTVFLMDFEVPAADPALWLAAIEFQTGSCRVTIELAAASHDELAKIVMTLPSLTFYGP
jgi:thiol-disulfide isomerase/thioredoxin